MVTPITIFINGRNRRGNKMKKFIFGIVIIVAGLVIGGTFWNLNVQKEHAFDNYQKELAKRDKKIKKLEDSVCNLQDSILKLNTRIDLYGELSSWFYKNDYAHYDKATHMLWNVMNE